MTVRGKRLMRIAQVVLLGGAVLLTVLNVVAVADRGSGSDEIASLLERYTAPGKSDGNSEPDANGPARTDTQPEGNPAQKKKPGKKKPAQSPQVERICKRHVFSPEPKKKQSPPQLIGVLGDLAFFKTGTGCAVGQTHQGAKVLKIGPDWVEVEIKGKNRKIHVWTPGGGGPSPSPGRGPPGAMPMGIRGGGRSEPRPAPTGAMPPEMIERFKKMPPEIRRRAMERMPAEMRQKIEE